MPENIPDLIFLAFGGTLAILIGLLTYLVTQILKDLRELENRMSAHEVDNASKYMMRSEIIGLYKNLSKRLDEKLDMVISELGAIKINLERKADR